MAERNPSLFGGLLMLALAIIGAAAIGAWAIHDAKRSGDTVSVTGSARKPITADLVVWRGNVSRQHDDFKTAFRDVKFNMDGVLDYLKSKQVTAEELTVHPVENYPLYGRNLDGSSSSKIVGYNFSQMFEIRSGRIEAITALSRDVSDLIEKGIQLQSYRPEYYYTKLADLRVEMIGKATKDAKLRAEMLGEAAGFRVGPVRSARTGVFQITARNSTEVSDYGVYDTSTIEKDIAAVVKVTFGVD